MDKGEREQQIKRRRQRGLIESMEYRIGVLEARLEAQTERLDATIRIQGQLLEILERRGS